MSDLLKDLQELGDYTEDSTAYEAIREIVRLRRLLVEVREYMETIDSSCLPLYYKVREAGGGEK